MCVRTAVVITVSLVTTSALGPRAYSEALPAPDSDQPM